MIKISNIKLPINYNDSDIVKSICKKAKINADVIRSFTLLKRSLDARHKNDIKYILSVKVELNTDEKAVFNHAKSNEISEYFEEKYNFFKAESKDKKVVVVGSGPAGLFCAYTLIKCGIKPLIIERGEKIEERVKSVNNFFENGVLNTKSNIQFGEGGAGTFSDGKLNTGIKDKRIKLVLETFVSFGAPKEILYEQKPHIGTDILQKVIINFRNYIEKNGGKFLFNTQFTDFCADKGKIKSITVLRGNTSEKIECDYLILAIGHSARDTFYSLYDNKLNLQQKPFAVGVRIEHKQELINKIQFGNEYKNPHLPVADYKTAVHLPNGRSVYTFCMCPGGYVVAAASEQNRVVVNGMSNYKRDNENANSALLVNVLPQDFNSDFALAGVEFQRKIEEKAFNISKNYSAPCQTVGSFVFGNNTISNITPTYKPSVTHCDLGKIFPEFITNSLKQGILLIDKKLKGFADENAILTAPETRSSSPVRIVRNAEFMSDDIFGIFPCGEGAGYAGGITSAAVDGIKVAEAVIKA